MKCTGLSLRGVFVGHAALIAVCVGSAMALVACSSMGDDKKSDAPEPATGNIVDGTHTQILRMPDGFRNVAFTCYGTVGVYVTSRGPWQNGTADLPPLPSSIALMPNDPHCTTQTR